MTKNKPHKNNNKETKKRMKIEEEINSDEMVAKKPKIEGGLFHKNRPKIAIKLSHAFDDMNRPRIVEFVRHLLTTHSHIVKQKLIYIYKHLYYIEEKSKINYRLIVVNRNSTYGIRCSPFCVVFGPLCDNRNALSVKQRWYVPTIFFSTAKPLRCTCTSHTCSENRVKTRNQKSNEGITSERNMRFDVKFWIRYSLFRLLIFLLFAFHSANVSK